MSSRTRLLLLSLIPVGLAALVHHGVLGNDFASDDYLHLFQLTNTGVGDFVLRPHAGHLYLARNSIFAVFFELFGLRATPYLAFALLAHLVNAGLLFHVVRGLTRSALVALFAASLWGMSPINQGSLGWISAHGHVFIGTCLLWILLDLNRLRNEARAPRRSMMIRWYALLLVASTLYGVGLAVAMSMVPVLALLLPPTPEKKRIVWSFSSLFVVLPALYFLLISFAVGRPSFGLGNWISLGFHCLLYSFSSLLLGPLVATDRHGEVLAGPLAGQSGGTLLAIAYVTAALFAAWLVVRAWRGRDVRWREILAFLIVAAAGYGLIGLGRAGLLGNHGFDVAWGMTQPRYHYVGQLSLCLVFAVALGGATIAGRRTWGTVLLVAWALAAVPLYAIAGRDTTAYVSPDSRLELARTLEEMRAEIEERPEGTTVFLRNRPFIGPRLLPGARRQFPGWAAIYVIAHPENVFAGRRVYFVETDENATAFADASEGTRIHEILVTPKERTKILRAERRERHEQSDG